MASRRLALLAERNLALALEIWAGACDGGGVERGDGWLLVFAAAPLRSFNNVLLTSATAQVTSALDAAHAQWGASGAKYRVRARDDAGVDPRVLEAAGLVRAGGIPSLVLTDAGAGPLPEIDMRDVRDEQTLSDHVLVVASAFGWEPDVLERVFTPRLLQDERLRAFVGYVDGRPAATAQVVLGGDGTAGVYNLGTVEQYRGQGLGEAMTRRAMNEAVARGCSTVSLQASPMGLPIYERMDFRQVSYYAQYLPAEQAPR